MSQVLPFSSLTSDKAFALLPEWEATYLNYAGDPNPQNCYKAIYQVPENKAFWSITVYGSDGYMKSEDSIINGA